MNGHLPCGMQPAAPHRHPTHPQTYCCQSEPLAHRFLPHYHYQKQSLNRVEEGLQFRVILDLDQSRRVRRLVGLSRMTSPLLFEVPLAIELANRNNQIINMYLRIWRTSEAILSFNAFGSRFISSSSCSLISSSSSPSSDCS